VLQVSAFPNLRLWMFIIFDALSHKSPRVKNSHGEVMNLVKVLVISQKCWSKHSKSQISNSHKSASSNRFS